jgi:hypothetical protein
MHLLEPKHLITTLPASKARHRQASPSVGPKASLVLCQVAASHLASQKRSESSPMMTCPPGKARCTSSCHLWRYPGAPLPRRQILLALLHPVSSNQSNLPRRALSAQTACHRKNGHATKFIKSHSYHFYLIRWQNWIKGSIRVVTKPCGFSRYQHCIMLKL